MRCTISHVMRHPIQGRGRFTAGDLGLLLRRIHRVHHTFIYTLLSQSLARPMQICLFCVVVVVVVVNRPSSGERSTVGRVGLRNLGNTCYINSCLQQLFMMEPLRNGLLSLDLKDTDSNKCVSAVSEAPFCPWHGVRRHWQGE